MNTLHELYAQAAAKLQALDATREQIATLRAQAAASPHERDTALATVDLTDDAALARIAAIPARAEAMKRRADLMTEELQHGDAGLRPLAEQLHGAVVSALEARVEPLVSRAVAAVAPFCNGLDPESVARDLPAVRVVLGEARTVLHPTAHATFETALRALVSKTTAARWCPRGARSTPARVRSPLEDHGADSRHLEDQDTAGNICLAESCQISCQTRRFRCIRLHLVVSRFR